MTRFFRSNTPEPLARGREFGTAHASQIAANIAIYQRMFDELAGGSFDGRAAGHEALKATLGFAPPLHEEMTGIAQGAGVDPALIGMLNARTEVLALLKAGTRGECSAVIHVPAGRGAPVAVQTWDWFFASKDSWLVWEIPLADGSVTKTMTEYGIVGKSGLNTRGLGLLFTILHHEADGGRIGLPVHIAARWTLDTAPNAAKAAELLSSADVSASSSINLASYENGVAAAITAELYPGGPGFVVPDDRGYIVHTNHFLAADPATRDATPKTSPDTLQRHDYLRRELTHHAQPTASDILHIMANHSGGKGDVCCHCDPKAAPSEQYETLSTVILGLDGGELTVLTGGPCRNQISPIAKTSSPALAL